MVMYKMEKSNIKNIDINYLNSIDLKKSMLFKL